MKKISILLGVIVTCFTFSSCNDPNNENGNQNTYPATADVILNAVKDKDGNKYDAVRIGDQVWMASNLKTTHYADGTEIPMGTLGDASATEPYRYYPNNNQNNVDTYGYLYNWPAVMHGSESSETNPSGVQGICPDGWHVPSGREWSELEDYLETHLEYSENGGSVATALTSANGGWYPTELAGRSGYVGQNLNRTGFNALPAGIYEGNGSGGFSCFGGFGGLTCFWSCTTYTEHERVWAVGRSLEWDGNGSGNGNSYDFSVGYSVRCLRD